MGIAIRQIQKPGDIGTFAFVDNLNRAIQHSGRIINSMIPEVYDTQRDIRVRKEDGTEQFMPINIPASEYMQHIGSKQAIYGKFKRPEAVRLSNFMLKFGANAKYNSMGAGKFEVIDRHGAELRDAKAGNVGCPLEIQPVRQAPSHACRRYRL